MGSGVAPEALTSGQPQSGLDALTVVRLNGALQIGAGIFLAIGKFRGLAALVLIGSIVPTTYTGQRFWEEDDDVKRGDQKTQLLKNLGLAGGLIFAAVDTEGAPSLSWRARRRVSQLIPSGPDVDAHHTASRAVEVSRRAGRRARRASVRATSGAPRDCQRCRAQGERGPRRTQPKRGRPSPPPTSVRSTRTPTTPLVRLSMSPVPTSPPGSSGLES